jgi:hypothetical protein
VWFWSEVVRRRGNTTDWPYRDLSFFARGAGGAKQPGRTIHLYLPIETERPPEGGLSTSEPEEKD